MARMNGTRTSGLWVGAVTAAVLVSLGGGDALAAKHKGSAPKQTKIKVLGMQVEGSDLAAKDKADLFHVVQAKLRSYPKIDLLKPPERELTDEMIDLECIDIDLDCLGKLGKKYKAEQVFYTQVDKKGSGFELLVRVVDTAGKKPKFKRNERTPVPTFTALANAMEREVEAVFGKPPAPADGAGYLEVSATPAGAKIFVNGDYAGTSNVKLKEEPGTYSLRVARDGYQESVMTVVVAAGKTVTRKIELEGLPDGVAGGGGGGEGVAAATPFYKTWWFWTAVGVVVVGTTVAIAATSNSSPSQSAGAVIFSVDPQNAWRDAAVMGGAQ